jgi:hypothetical protein
MAADPGVLCDCCRPGVVARAAAALEVLGDVTSTHVDRQVAADEALDAIDLLRAWPGLNRRAAM